MGRSLLTLLTPPVVQDKADKEQQVLDGDQYCDPAIAQ